MIKKTFFLVLFLTSFLVAQENERSLEETIQLLSQDAAKRYINPVSSAYGANLNAGWFHRAPADEKISLHLAFGLVGMGATPPDDAKRFKTNGSFKFSQREARTILEQSSDFSNLPVSIQQVFIEEMATTPFSVEMEGATIIGRSDDYFTIRFPGQTITANGQSVEVPDTEVQIKEVAGYKGLAKASTLPLAAAQLMIGTVYGTNFTFRYLPSVELEDGLGRFNYFGFGIQHNPKAWVELPIPFNVSASFFTQKMNVGEIFKVNTVAFGINASKQFGIRALNVRPYAGIMLENSTMEVSYNYLIDAPSGLISQDIDFELQGENSARLTLGLSIRFFIINVNADYNIAAYNNFSVGVNIAM